MKKLLLLVFLTSAVLWSCRQQEGSSGNEQQEALSGDEQREAPSSGLTFDIREFLKQSPSCGTDSNYCATVRAYYPLAVAGPEEVVRQINDTINEYVRISLAVFALSPEDIPSGLDEVAASFIDEYEEVTSEETDFVTPWSVELDGSVVFESAEVVSVELSTYSYAGGAHPNSFVFLLPFDAKTGKKLTLTEMVGDTAQLMLLAESAFMEARGLDPGQDVSESGFFWGEDFQLPENITIAEEGLYFYYNPYEAAAYVAGPTEFTIPFEELEGILKFKVTKD